ncbi:ALS2 C-terminal-like protein isoform X1 [Poecile atricapillus]|uniref:ALS2 C-terminal-like protein isoform X1 n=2 Tax=Poecile atricapillus TaxID=48891 RepID=UPI002739E485|nr:ALS2 C-terminal-like protein isoform X1 [Poecile atricapillus]
MWEGKMGGKNSSLGKSENSQISEPAGDCSSREFAPCQAMSVPGILGSLLQEEEKFSSCLARLDALILKPLLQAEPNDPKEKENFQLLVLLNDRFQALWNFTEENSRILRGSESGCIQDFYILWKGDLFLSLSIQYFVTFANFVVVQGFERAAGNKSEAWKRHKAVLKEFLRDFSSERSLAPALHSELLKPFREHGQSCLRLLRQLREQLQEGPERDAAGAVEREFGKLESFVSQVLDEAARTKELWNSLGCKFTDVLRVPERRLLEDSRNLPIASGGSRSERLLLFDDVLVLIQGNSFQSFDLKLVWVDENCGEKLAPGSHGLRVTTPEETFVLSTKDPQTKAVWRWKLEQAVRQALNGKRDFPLWGGSGDGAEAPSRRFFSYGFRRDGRLRGATYEGEWLEGKPHGKGTLKWSDGRNHVGDFRDGREHGFGIRLVPRRSEDRYDCYKCHWQQGRMSGYGICEYGDGQVYKGYFKDDKRHGFGILENSSAQNPFKYTGHWEKDKKSGYGVWEDKERGERYLGMWWDDRRHGDGIVVTHSGLCYQRRFQADKMVGSGILFLEDGSVYEGNFTEDLTFVGKGRLSLADGSGQATPQLGLKEFPVEKRWAGIFQQFQEFLHSGCKEETEEFFTGFNIQTGKELRKSREFLCGQGGAEELSWRNGNFPEELGREPEALRRFLEKALRCPRHPLGKLLRALGSAFQASYSGPGSSRLLLGMAQAEVQLYARKIWEFARAFLRLPSDDADPRGSGPVLPLILSRFYPELSVLYLLQHQRQDELYSRGIQQLGQFPDSQLLEFLGVHKHLWPLQDPIPSRSQDFRCFRAATERLQRLLTTVDPKEKLEFLCGACRALAAPGSRLPMDELLPLLLFTVARARIQHLGAELHLIRDFMDPSQQGGMSDFLLTALESCYEHIQRIRIHPKENSHSS